MTKGEWLEKALSRLRAVRDEARAHELGQLAYLIEGAAREAESQLPDEAPQRVPNAYSPQTLADRWQCSAALIRTLIARGELEAIPFGGKLVRITRQTVEAFEARGGSIKD